MGPRSNSQKLSQKLVSLNMAPGIIRGSLQKLTLGFKPSRRKVLSIQQEEPRLPTIVCEVIIDFVARERLTEKVWDADVLKTLRACSLTCRAWRTRSQHHLFRFIVVKCTPKLMTGIVALLDEHPALGSRVELLVIKSKWLGEKLPDKIPSRIPEMLAGVPEIRLSDCYIHPTSRFDSTLVHFTALTSLNFFYVEFKAFDDMRRIIMLFPHLTVFTINATGWRGSQDVPPPSIVLPVKQRLREVYLAGSAKWSQDPRTHTLFEWLAESGISSGLKVAKLQNLMVLDDTTFALVQRLIDAARPSLTTLSFSPAPELDYTSLGETLLHCVNLQLLALVIPYHLPSFTRLLTFLERDLGYTPYLSIRFSEYPRCCPPAPAEWNRLDNVLQSPKWTTLLGLFLGLIPKLATSSSFIWGDPYQDRPFDADIRREMFRESLPSTHKRGIVQYWRGDDEGYLPL